MVLTPEQQRTVTDLVAITYGGPIRAVPVGGSSGAPEKVSDERFKAMSAAERLDYCRRFPQHLPKHRRQDDAAMPAWRDPRLPK
jgi:hypothetical protein